jgi:hypothetical protein
MNHRWPSIHIEPGGTVAKAAPAKTFWSSSSEHLRRCTYLSLDDNLTSGALDLTKAAEFEPPHVTTYGIDPIGIVTVSFDTVDLPKPAVF